MSGSLRAVGFLGLAVASGSGALLALYGLIRGYEERLAEIRRPEDTVMVIVAARDLYPGLPIAAEDLYAVQIAPRLLPDGVFLSPEHVVGRIPRERVLANDLLRGERLADPENGVGLETVIPRGLRAISVDIADGPALQGFLKPGSYVDVIVTLKPEQPEAKVTTKTLLQAVFVLGVDSRMRSESADEARERRGQHRPSVTLLVTADQAEQVAHAHVLGDITLSLRPDDVAVVEGLDGVTLADLQKSLGPKGPVVRRKKPVVAASDCAPMKVIHGDGSSEVWFDSKGNPCTPVPADDGSR